MTRFSRTLAHNKLLIGVAIVALLVIAQPSSNPINVQVADAASYSHQLYAQWRMEEPSDLGGLFGVKAAVSWSTSDPSPACYDSRRGTGIAAIDQNAALDYPGVKCGAYGTPGPTSHEYPMAVSDYTCWISKSALVSVQVDSCGPVASWWNSAPYYYTIGVHFRACVGIINTPFSVCESYVSLLHLGGSEVWVQYQGG